MPSRRKRRAKSKVAPGRISIWARTPPALAGESRKMRRRSDMRGSCGAGPWTHEERSGRIAPDHVEFIETFARFRALEPLESPDQRGDRDFRGTGALRVLA